MKLIVTIIRDEDNEPVSQALIESGFRVTRIASTGGFLRHGSSTLMIVVEDTQLEQAISVIRDSCAPPSEPGMKRGTLFVLPVAKFEQV
jgi:uncharacterized protein YaaQ